MFLEEIGLFMVDNEKLFKNKEKLLRRGFREVLNAETLILESEGLELLLNPIGHRGRAMFFVDLEETSGFEILAPTEIFFNALLFLFKEGILFEKDI